MNLLARNLLVAGAYLVLGWSVAHAQSGQVKSEGQPIPGATVRATQGDRILTTLTDQNGEFHFDGMAPGQWNVEAEMFGFARARKEVQVPSRIELTLELRTRPAGRGGPGIPTEDALEGGQLNAAFSDMGANPQAPVDASNESLLVNGSISQGLQASQA